MRNKDQSVRYNELVKRIDKLSGVKKELISMKDRIEKANIQITVLKKDNTIMRKLIEDLKEKFIKRRMWQHISTESQKRKKEELKNEGENNTNTDADK